MKFINRVSTKPEHCRSDGSNEKSKINRKYLDGICQRPKCTAGGRKRMHKRIAQYLSAAHRQCAPRCCCCLKVTSFWKNHTWRRMHKRTVLQIRSFVLAFTVYTNTHAGIFLLPTENKKKETTRTTNRRDEKKYTRTYRIHIFYGCFACKYFGSLFALHWNWIINKSPLCRPTNGG